VIAAGLGLACAVYACIGEIYDSVHYNDARPNFGDPPSPVVVTVWSESPGRPVADSTPWDGQVWDEAKEKATEERISRLKGQVDRAIQSEQYSTAKSALQLLLKEEIEDREVVADQLEVVTQNETGHLPVGKLLTYFKARREDTGSSALSVIAKDDDAGFLRAHAAYGLAAWMYDRGKYLDAAKQFELVAETYPESPRREAALIMAVRTRLRGEDRPKGAFISPENMKLGRKAIEALRKDYPQSRFLANADGWETRALLFEGKSAEAFLRYLGELPKAKGYDQKVGVLASLEQVRSGLKPAEADKVRSGLFEKPDLLEPYLDLRLYHGGEKAKLDFGGLAKLAKEVLAKKPSVALSAGIMARLAEIAYLQGSYDDAAQFARDSLAQKSESKAEARRDLATYVLAGSLTKQRVLREAVSTYEKLIAEFQDSYLVGAARENLALLHEQFGEWGKALDQYRVLEYRFDVATLVDVRMTVDELLQYVKDHQGDPELDRFKFALGMRYLRKDNLTEAERWFKEIPEARRKEIGQVGSRDYAWNNEEESGYRDLLADPLKTIEDLNKLRVASASLTEPDAKAAAQYALASYWYERRNLLLYNPSLWNGGRGLLSAFWDAGVDKAGYQKAIQEHHYEHECLWRARKICVVLAKEFPNSTVAPKALYRAACAARRLADFNPYWREAGRSKPLWNEAISLMEQVAAKYPKDPLAKNAAKYAKVFKEERDDANRSTYFAD